MDPFKIKTDKEFENIAIAMFKTQFKNNIVYNKYCSLLGVLPEKIDKLIKIPFLPIQFFKTHKVISSKKKISHIFKSSGTTGDRSINYVSNIDIYIKSFSRSFENFYGPIKDYTFLALVPSYLEQKNSSLVFMLDNFIQRSVYEESEFYLYNHKKLYKVLHKLKDSNRKIILFGVSYALLNFIEKNPIKMKNLIVIETGGMKGMREEITRDQLHNKLKKGFGTVEIHSEYGMTELFSQAYAKNNKKFYNPNWMKTLTREITNPLNIQTNGKGAINIIDLANENSCAFIATDDIGIVYKDNSYEITGRLNEAEIRGCNQLFNDN